ncbi:hypothetical protein SCA6_018212 [Theobroma cacao]
MKHWQIPWQIGSLLKLETLICSENNLEGPIPSSTLPFQMGNLQNLEVLDLVNNSLTGFIPPSIFNISTAKSIGLNFNRFSGQLPSTTGLGLPKLQALHLAVNELSGPIPSSISNASQLIYLQLLNNSFSGKIPTTIGRLRDLQNNWYMKLVIGKEPDHEKRQRDLTTLHKY